MGAALARSFLLDWPHGRARESGVELPHSETLTSAMVVVSGFGVLPDQFGVGLLGLLGGWVE